MVFFVITDALIGKATRKYMVSRVTPFLFRREKSLIALLYAIGGRADATDFQKLLFLYCQRFQSTQEGTLNSTYEFVPYQYGAYSFSSNHDRKRLIQRSILRDSPQDWKLTKNGEKTARNYVDSGILAFSEEFQTLRGEQLIGESYRRYPYYAIRSSMREDVLGDDRLALKRIDDAIPTSFKSRLFTIGYERRSLEYYLNQLILNNVSVLIDVRSNLVSRRYGFSKRVLSDTCEKVDIEYRHMPELGIDSLLRRNLSSSQDYYRLFNEYNRFLLDCCDDEINEILDTVQKDQLVVLTCYERNPHECHRHVLAEVLSSHFNFTDRSARHQKLSESSQQTVEVSHL